MTKLDKIFARCDTATPEPWAHNHIQTEWGDVHGVLIPFDLGLDFEPEYAGHGQASTDADCKFVAHARENIPYLLARAEKAEAENR